MPGAPWLIVERGWLYEWCRTRGYDPSARGFASMDWLIMSRPAMREPLAPQGFRDYIAAQIVADPAPADPAPGNRTGRNRARNRRHSKLG